MGLVGVLGSDTVTAVDFTISDGGGSKDTRLLRLSWRRHCSQQLPPAPQTLTLAWYPPSLSHYTKHDLMGGCT